MRVGMKVKIWQPQTPYCRGHWLDTVVTIAFPTDSDGETEFRTERSVTDSDGDYHCDEFYISDQGSTWELAD